MGQDTIEVERDVARARIIIRVRGEIEPATAEHGAASSIAALRALDGAPFDVVVDLGRCSYASDAVFRALARVQTALGDSSVRRVIRIPNPSDLVNAMFEVGGRQAGYETANAASVADALSILDGAADSSQA